MHEEQINNSANQSVNHLIRYFHHKDHTMWLLSMLTTTVINDQQQLSIIIVIIIPCLWRTDNIRYWLSMYAKRYRQQSYKRTVKTSLNIRASVAALHQGVPRQITWLEDTGSALLCLGNHVNRK